MAAELYHSFRKITADDDLEGTLFRTSIMIKVLTYYQSRLAISRNANDESEVDESMLNAGLFTYPVLQAADILAYK